MTRPNGKRATIERDFARALSFEVVKAGGLRYRTVVARLRRLERSYLPLVPAKSVDALEMRRRIAEQIYQHALSHGCSPVVCRSKLRTLFKLGFTDVERKAHFYLMDARYALSRGDNLLARTTAVSMIRELEDAPKRGRNPLRKQLLGLTKALLQQAGDPATMRLQELAAQHATSGRKRRELEALERTFKKYQFNMGKRTWKREDLHERR